MEKSKRTIQGVNVAVIGGAGFLGSHLVDHLIDDRNCNVIVLDNLIVGQKKFVNPKAKFIWFDITGSESQLRKIFENEKIEYVFNYAAEPYIPVSFSRPSHVLDINTVGALRVMTAAQDAGVKGILQVSSAEIYGNGSGHKMTEDEPVVPHSTYGVTKTALDGLVQVRWKEAKTPAIAMRQFNCIGERETHPYIVTTIIEQLNESNEVKLGNNSFRDFQYAGDAVKMAVELLEKGEFGEVYNMGAETGIKMYDLAHLIGKLMGKEITVIEDESRKRPWEIWHLQSDNTKLFSIIDFRPQTTLEEMLTKTINYFKENGNKWDF